jgi:hypothetical protein
MVIDFQGAPVERTVDVGGDPANLGTVSLPRGSVVRFTDVTRERLDREGLMVRGTATAPVAYERYAGGVSHTPGDLVLGGFAAGEVRVMLVRTHSQEVLAERVVTVDGVHDVDVTFDR